ncbi:MULTISPECIES: hypothetical protein [Pseudobacteroides]|uniref:Uncharacterized protein n=1 Tax=Pseudobacteroides cellulosolvens ATCC 35603 = DSM 2933 TaxID=398512 RepID=A0A0L6JT26_9FIRM|nr:hypothetical protein [Pseudobacteroides cellulosolvens]KNY29001.1 hypothetical protein Bccel_4275 [Pseudobacteroides cellulosolvens ATCC 35603 = DSM 2933]
MNSKFNIIKLTNGYQLIYHDKFTGIRAELNFINGRKTSTEILKKLLRLGLLPLNEIEEIMLCQEYVG